MVFANVYIQLTGSPCSIKIGVHWISGSGVDPDPAGSNFFIYRFPAFHTIH